MHKLAMLLGRIQPWSEEQRGGLPSDDRCKVMQRGVEERVLQLL